MTALAYARCGAADKHGFLFPIACDYIVFLEKANGEKWNRFDAVN